MLKDNLKGYEDFIADIRVKFENHNNKDIMRIRVPKQTTAIYPSPVKKLENICITSILYKKW